MIPAEVVLYASIVPEVDAANLPSILTYSIPPGLELELGDAVLAPLGPSREIIGYVTAVSQHPPDIEPGRIKPVSAKIEGARAFNEQLWELACWISDQTLSDIRESVHLVAPDLASVQTRTRVYLTQDWQTRIEAVKSPPQKELLDRLSAAVGQVLDANVLLRGVSSAANALLELRKKELVSIERSTRPPASRSKTVRLLTLVADESVALEEADRLQAKRAYRQARLLRELASAFGAPRGLQTFANRVQGLTVEADDSAAARTLVSKGLAGYREVSVRRDPFGSRYAIPSAPPALSDEQAHACAAIGEAIASGEYKPFLLFGVTGSGKTEVYLDAVARVRRTGQSAILLLPEIGLTTQVLDLLKARFGDEVAVLHSALSPGERFDEWQRIRAGEAPIVVGARSAVFSPTPNLGLIIVDEEHEGAYKQDSAPRYHARDVALFRARQSGATCVLGSATPSLESYYQAKIGVYSLLTLTRRVSERPLPSVTLVDLRGKGFSKGTDGASSILSPPLQDALALRLARGEQSILFLNRRGFAPFLLCRDCGFSFKCNNCDVTLTYHQSVRRLQCHHCDFRQPAPDTCPQCSSLRLRPMGLGTEKVEECVRQTFVGARTLRMDRDTTERKGAHADILDTFRKGGADVLIGTQMVAKGLDFPNVTLVGVVMADTALNMPDFHAAERSFQLLAQVGGRAGRGESPGEVIVQTFDPEHESIQFAMRHDFVGFYYWEVAQRRELNYPPLGSLANVVSIDESEQHAIDRIEAIAARIRQDIGCMDSTSKLDTDLPVVVGPAACPIARARNRYRWHLLVRAGEHKTVLAVLRSALSRLSPQERHGLTVDIDPMTML